MSVQPSRIKALGRRPLDYAARDMLIGSTQRDRRCWNYRKLVADPPEELLENLSHLPGKSRHQALQLLVIERIHQECLARFHHLAPEVVARARACPLHGALLSLSSAQTCGRARICPWCFTRRAVTTYRHVSSKLDTQGPAVFCLMTAIADDETIANEESVPDDFSSRVKWIRSRFSKSMRQWCQFFGVSAGVISFVIGPHRFPTYSIGGSELTSAMQYGFSYRVAALGMVSDLGQLRSQLQNGVHTDTLFSPATIKIRQGPSSLRELVFGLSLRHLSATNSEGDCGLFRAEPWFLATQDQWLLHRQATFHMPAITYFGDWHEQQSQPLRQINDSRHRRAGERLQACLTLARPVFRELTQRLGHPPGRPTLLQELRCRGIDLPDGNVAKTIVRALKEESNGNNRH